MSHRFFNLFRRAALSREISRELDFHIVERTDQLIAGGVPRREAERLARRQFGAYAIHKEDTWMNDLVTWLESLSADVRYAARGLRNSPGFAAAAILSLALGIGANTAIFTLIDAVMLRALPVQHPEQLMHLQISGNRNYFSNPLWEQVRDRQEIFTGVAAWSTGRANLSPTGESRYVANSAVSGSFFPLLGVTPALGRLLTPADDRRGCAPVAVLSHALWQRMYGGNLDVVGNKIVIEGHPFEIVGVARAGFTGLDVGQAVDIFTPICTEAVIGGAQSALDQPTFSWLSVLARAKPGMSEAQIKARLEAWSPAAFAATVPPRGNAESQKQSREMQLIAEPAPSGISGARRQYGDAMWILMAAVGLVLLIACANVANLLLARSTARAREMAVRTALGAGRVRLIRQALTESLLLSFLGAALGLLFAQWGSRLLTAILSTRRTIIFLDLTPDPRVLAFTAAAGTLTGLLFGLVPALRSSRVAPIGAMKAQGRAAGNDGGSRMLGTKMILSKSLVVAQVALSTVLVAGAGLMLTTFRNLTSLDAGYRADGVLLVNANLVRLDLPVDKKEAFRRDILNRLRAIPGVRSASFSMLTPITGGAWSGDIKVGELGPDHHNDTNTYMNGVSDGYFDTFGTPLLAGRDFSSRDNASSPNVAVINESMAARYFGKASAIGHTFELSGENGWSPVEIVGVVRDVKYRNLRQEVPPTAYMPVSQHEFRGRGPMFFELHVAGSLASIIPSVRETFIAASPNVTIELIPFTERIADSLTQERLMATLSTFFGGLALLLAAVGLYGVLSYNVVRRRNEIGIRMALGAEQARVLRMVLGEAGWLAFTGLGLGLAATLAATRVVQSFLYGLQPDDPKTLAAATALLALIAGVAAYLPARRASQVDPMTALRDE